MREIKFRAYQDKTMYQNVMVGGYEETVPVFYVCGRGWVHLDGGDITKLMQYTGLKDKNDEDVYEGDIVKFHYDNGIYKYINAKVMFGSGKFYLRADENGYSLSNNMRIDNSWQIEVVGNIYENPELFGVVEYEVDDEE